MLTKITYTNNNSYTRRESRLDKVDYDRALFYIHRSEWDNLLILMVRTKDHFLAKKIEHFLHANYFSHDYFVIERRLYALLHYIEHANNTYSVTHPFEEAFY
jgi:hypothetical protein